MTLRLFVAVVFLAFPVHLAAQENQTLVRALAAYESLDYAAAIDGAQQAVRERLTQDERLAAYELLGFVYGALDSTGQAVAAFRELIFLDPNREPDPLVVSPRIRNLYASALGQILVVRRLQLDSTSFVAGSGNAIIRYQVSRPSDVVTRVVGNGQNIVVDSSNVAADGFVTWNVTRPGGDPLPAGTYQIIVQASEFGNEYSTPPLDAVVIHGSVDTLPLLVALPDFTQQPESETPARNWTPLGMSVLYTSVAAGAALLLESGGLDVGSRREVISISAVTLLAGFVSSLRQPEPRPLQVGILYNELLRDVLRQRNVALMQQNVNLRRQVVITVKPAGSDSR